MPADQVYIIRQGDTRLFKIGVSNNPMRRLKNLQTGNPHPLKMMFSVACHGLSAYEAEALIHRHLSKERVKGEWFDIQSDDRVVSIAQCMLNALSGKEDDVKTKDDERDILSQLPDVPTHEPRRTGQKTPREPSMPQ